MTKYPQRLVNIKVSDKHAVEQNEHVAAVIKEVEDEMNGEGRVLVRPSGTEPLVRVMVEAKTDEDAERFVNKISDVVRAHMGL